MLQLRSGATWGHAGVCRGLPGSAGWARCVDPIGQRCAWSAKGHGAGLHEQFRCVCELVDLLRCAADRTPWAWTHGGHDSVAAPRPLILTAVRCEMEYPLCMRVRDRPLDRGQFARNPVWRFEAGLGAHSPPGRGDRSQRDRPPSPTSLARSRRSTSTRKRSMGMPLSVHCAQSARSSRSSRDSHVNSSRSSRS